MARIDDLNCVVVNLQDNIERILSRLADLQIKIETATSEDPRIGSTVDVLVAINQRISDSLPPINPTIS